MIILTHHYGYLLKVLSGCMKTSMDNTLASMDLTSAQGHIMGYLAQRSQPPCSRDIEETFHLSHPTVSGLLSRLEKKDFIELRPDETDRRCRLLTLTPKATGTLEAIHSHLKRTEEQLLQDFTPEEQELLQQLLVKAAKNIEATLPPTRNGHPVEPPPIGRC